MIIESPFSGDTLEERNTHRHYALACLRDSLDRGEAPIASHLLHTQVLDDDVPEDRRKGMRAGWAWYGPGVVCAVYSDLGVSDGMATGVGHAVLAGCTVELRELGEDWPERFAFLWAGEDQILASEDPGGAPEARDETSPGTAEVATIRNTCAGQPSACSRCGGPHASSTCPYYGG